MAKNFLNTVPMKVPGKARHDLSHDHKFSCNMGYLIPCLTMEVLPGDELHMTEDALTRLAPLVSPMMHRVDQYIHRWYVPNRQLWPNWDKFIFQQQTGAVLPAHPFIRIQADGGGDPDAIFYTPLMNYMGIPRPIGAAVEKVNALPFYGILKIYNEFYRDQNLINPMFDTAIDGDNTTRLSGALALLRRAWEHDYFTGGLPQPQKGGEVVVPMGDVYLKSDSWATNKPSFRENISFNESAGDLVQTIDGAGDGSIDTQGVAQGLAYDPKGTLGVNAGTIEDLRKATSLQRFFERAARVGSRVKEGLLGFFGVRSRNMELDLPVYLGGSATPIMVSEVLNTTGTAELPQGNMAGHGVATASGNPNRYFCPEHGFVHTIFSMRPKPSYQQGLQKFWIKGDSRYDYFFPDFAHLGEQPVWLKEVYAFNNSDDTVFCYQPAYSDYRIMPNRVSGDFQTTLDTWHMGRIFENAPSFNSQFVNCDPTFRVFAVTDPTVDHVYVQMVFRISKLSLVPKYGVPAL